jgi:glycosyltransferase involved in cell wall biosynthesis
MPSVSVIIPTYNRRDLVKEAVYSVLQQSFTDFEVLVIDDGSTDNTQDITKQIDNKQVRYYYKENGGISNARNTGLSKAKGKYVALLDSDDLWPKKYLEIMLNKLERNPDYGMAYSSFKDIYPDGREAEGLSPERYLSGQLTMNYFGKMPCILPSATIFRKSAIEDLFFDEHLKYTEDIDFFLRLSAKTKFLYVPDVSVTRKVQPDSMSFEAGTNLSPNTVLILERFYLHLGGDKIVPAKTAKRKISRMYRSLARKHYRHGHRKAAISLFKKAISYYPYALQYYTGLLKAMLLSKEKDKLPDWQMPKPLPRYISTLEKETRHL